MKRQAGEPEARRNRSLAYVSRSRPYLYIPRPAHVRRRRFCALEPCAPICNAAPGQAREALSSAACSTLHRCGGVAGPGRSAACSRRGCCDHSELSPVVS